MLKGETWEEIRAGELSEDAPENHAFLILYELALYNKNNFDDIAFLIEKKTGEKQTFFFHSFAFDLLGFALSFKKRTIKI